MYHPQIRTFVIAVECGSFSKAADKLYLSTVSVMKQIDSLEKRLDVKLVERNRQGISLTQAGGVIYQAAKKIMELSENAQQKAIRLEKKSGKPTIYLATSLLHPSQEITKLWEHDDEVDFPFSIDLVPFLDGKDGLFNMLGKLGAGIDCFVSLFPDKLWKDQCSFLPLGKYRCCCAVPYVHPLAEKKQLKLEDLDGEALLMIKRGASRELDQLRDDLVAHHSHVTIIDAPYLYDASLFNQCVQMGCLLEIPEIWGSVHPSVKVVPLEDYTLTFGIIYAKEPSADVRDFIQAVSTLLKREQDVLGCQCGEEASCIGGHRKDIHH